MAIIKHIDIIEPGDPLVLMKKSLKETQVMVDKLAKSNKQLSQALQLVKKAGTGTEAKQLITLTNQLEKSTNKLTLSMTDEAKKLETVKVEQLRVNKVRKEAATLANENISLYQKESIRLNNLRKSYKDLALQNKQNTTEGKKMLANLTKLDKKLKDVDNTVGQNQRSVGKYGDATVQTNKKVSKLNRKIGQLATSFKGMGKQLAGALGVTALIGLLVNQFRKASQRATELNKLTRELKGTFDITTKEAKKLAAQINAIAQNFENVDVKALQTSLTAIVKTFDNLSEQEALDLIQEGFQKGSNNSGEFLDILKEYPVQFKAAGIDAQTMFAIINQQVKQGIYSDKGVDAIKEGGLRLRENTKAVQDALKPFDDYTKQQIKLAIESGNSFEAIQLVSKGLSDTKLTAAETQAVIADVFGGAGEDAGIEYILMLQNIQTNLKDVAKETTIVADANLALSTSYNKFVLSVSDGEGTISESMSATTLWFSELFDTLTAINEVDFAGKLKIAANTLVEFIDLISIGAVSRAAENLKELGIDVNKFKFSLEGSSKALKLNTIDHKENTRVIKEEDDVVVKLTAAQKKANAERAEENRIRAKRAKDIVPLLKNEVVAVKEVADAVVETEEEKQERLNSIVQDGSETRKNIRIRNAEETAELEAMIGEQALISSQQLASDIFSVFQDEKLAKLNSDSEAEKAILQQRLDDGVISEEQFASQIAAIDQKFRIASAKADKKKAIFDIAIRTAIAIISALTSIPPNIPLSITVGIIGAIQAAAVLATPIPKLKEGEINIDAPSHAQGGKLVEIEGGESYVSKEATSKSAGILNMVNDGILTDKNFSQMSREDTNMLLAGLLVQGNQKGDKMIHLLGKLGLVIPRGNENWIERANGNIERASKINLGDG